MNLDELRSLKPQILATAEQYGVSNIRVFGSVARGDADENSDVDLLVDVAEDVSLLGLVRCRRAIQDICGYAVDLVEASAIRNPLMRKHIFENIEAL